MKPLWDTCYINELRLLKQSTDPLNRADLILIGKIIKTRGLHGELKVSSLTDFNPQYRDLNSVLVKINDNFKPFSLRKVRFQRNFLLLEFELVNTLAEAELLVGAEIYIKRNQRSKLPQDFFYFEEIAGSKVVSVAGEEIGILTDVLHLPASDVLVIDREGNEVLIPFVKELVPEVNLKKRVLKVVNMPSLWIKD